MPCHGFFHALFHFAHRFRHFGLGWHFHGTVIGFHLQSAKVSFDHATDAIREIFGNSLKIELVERAGLHRRHPGGPGAQSHIESRGFSLMDEIEMNRLTGLVIGHLFGEVHRRADGLVGNAGDDVMDGDSSLGRRAVRHERLHHDAFAGFEAEVFGQHCGNLGGYHAQKRGCGHGFGFGCGFGFGFGGGFGGVRWWWHHGGRGRGVVRGCFNRECGRDENGRKPRGEGGESIRFHGLTYW